MMMFQHQNHLRQMPFSNAWSPKENSNGGKEKHAIGYQHGAGIESLMPKLHHSDYHTEPSIKELAAKERAEPGFCHRVKDFSIGRHGYGSIRFFGETELRRFELESIVQLMIVKLSCMDMGVRNLESGKGRINQLKSCFLMSNVQVRKQVSSIQMDLKSENTRKCCLRMLI